MKTQIKLTPEEQKKFDALPSLTPEQQRKMDVFANLLLDVAFKRVGEGYRIINGEEVKCFDGKKRIVNDQTSDFHKKDKKRLALKLKA